MGMYVQGRDGRIWELIFIFVHALLMFKAYEVFKSINHTKFVIEI